jgi:hypothetical protein
VAEEDLVESTAWSAESSTAEKREVAPAARDTTTSSTRRSAKGVANPKMLEENLVAEVRLEEMMLETPGLKEVIETGTSRRDAETTTAITIGEKAQNGAEVARDTKGGGSAASIREGPDVNGNAPRKPMTRCVN